MSPQELDRKIAEFATNPQITFEHLAMMKVGLEKGDDMQKEVMPRIIASILMRFHKLPIGKKDTERN